MVFFDGSFTKLFLLDWNPVGIDGFVGDFAQGG
jgi:hypothetical protein